MQVPALSGRRLDRIVDKDSGVVDQTADRPERSFGEGQQPLDRTLLGEISAEGHRSATLAANLLNNTFGRLARVMMMHGDGKAVLGEGEGEGSANSLRTTGNQRRLRERRTRHRPREH